MRLRNKDGSGSDFTFPQMHSHQRAFATSHSRFPLSLGGMGSGKSLSLIMRCLFLMTENPYFGNMAGNVGLLGRDTLKNLKRTTMADFFEFCPPSLIAHHDKQDGYVDLKNGSRLYFVHFEIQNDFRSMNLGFAAFDQIEDIPEKVWEEISIHRLRRTEGRLENNPITFHSAFGVANPCSNWVSQLWQANELLLESKDEEQKKLYDPDYEVIHSSVRDNAKFLPPDFIPNMEKKYAKTPIKAKMFMDGLWGALEGSTYNWTDDLILNENKIPSPEQDIILGFDHGESAPKAIIFVALTKLPNGRTKLLVYDELYERKLGKAAFVKLLDSKLQWHAIQRNLPFLRERILRVAHDPSFAQARDYDANRKKISILDEYNNHVIELGFALPFVPGKNAIEIGIDRVNELFDNELVEVNPKCVNFIREHKGLVNDPDKDGKPKDGQDDHLCDAFKYVVSTLDFRVLFPQIKTELSPGARSFERYRQKCAIQKKKEPDLITRIFT